MSKLNKPVIEVFEYTEGLSEELGIELSETLSDKDWIVVLYDRERIWVGETIAYTLDSPKRPYVVDFNDKIVWICGYA